MTEMNPDMRSAANVETVQYSSGQKEQQGLSLNRNPARKNVPPNKYRGRTAEWPEVVKASASPASY